jgi:hypothetical protein
MAPGGKVVKWVGGLALPAVPDGPPDGVPLDRDGDGVALAAADNGGCVADSAAPPSPAPAVPLPPCVPDLVGEVDAHDANNPSTVARISARAP